MSDFEDKRYDDGGDETPRPDPKEENRPEEPDTDGNREGEDAGPPCGGRQSDKFRIRGIPRNPYGI